MDGTDIYFVWITKDRRVYGRYIGSNEIFYRFKGTPNLSVTSGPSRVRVGVRSRSSIGSTRYRKALIGYRPGVLSPNNESSNRQMAIAC